MILPGPSNLMSTITSQISSKYKVSIALKGKQKNYLVYSGFILTMDLIDP